MSIQIKVAKIFRPLLAEKARYKAAFGGRGSGKTYFFAQQIVLECYRKPGTRAVCIREIQKSLRDSSKEEIEKAIQRLNLGSQFDVQRDRIGTPGDGSIIFTGMQDHTAESIKSLSGCRIAWVDEAQSLSERSLSLLRPTIRESDSEIWFSWNPTRKSDAVDKFLRQGPVDDAIVIKANWRDNPWFNEVLEGERQREIKRYPERYPHTYEGEYATSFEGAYYARVISDARAQRRIGHVAADPVLPLRAYFDIGGSGNRADATSIWIVQFVGQQIYILDYYEAIGQVLAFHVRWMRQHGYEEAKCFLPHDGVIENNVTGKRYADHWKDAGFDVTTIANQGRGAAMQRVEATRRIFPRCWFNEETTQKGLDALGFYHENRHEDRDIGLGPEHDWSSHAADAFGLMACGYEDPARAAAFDRPIIYPKVGVA